MNLTTLSLLLVALAAPARAGDAAVPQWSGERAMQDIATQLSFGPRALDTPGHEKAIRFIRESLAEIGARVESQQWTTTGSDGTRHTLTNLIARFNPDNPRRIIAGTHYDSIIRAYRDKANPDAFMPGANNSASGVAVLLETARILSQSASLPAGVDLVFFDGEEGSRSLGEGDPAWAPLGSPYFVKHLGTFYPKGKPEKSVILDMVCYKNLVLNPEPSSLASAGTEVDAFWRMGTKIAPRIFKNQPSWMPIGDDQSALAAAGIPSFLVIDFKYEPWFNTTQDTLDKCSAASLEAVGRTLVQYLTAP